MRDDTARERGAPGVEGAPSAGRGDAACPGDRPDLHRVSTPRSGEAACPGDRPDLHRGSTPRSGEGACPGGAPRPERVSTPCFSGAPRPTGPPRPIRASLPRPWKLEAPAKGLTRTERAVLGAIVEAAVRPDGVLPPVRATDAVQAGERWVASVAPVPRWLARGALLLGAALGLRRCDAARREQWLLALGPPGALALRFAAHLYVGDDGVARQLGFDAGAIVARAQR